MPGTSYSKGIVEKLAGADEPVFEIISRLAQRFLRREWPRLRERVAGLLVERDSLTHDIHEEVAADLQLRIHVGDAVIDEACLGPKPLPVRQLVEQPILGLRPEFRNVRQILVIDHHEQVVIRVVATYWIIHPVSPGVAAKQDDLEQFSRPKPRLRPMRDRLGEPLPDHAHHELQLAPFAFRQVVQALLHPRQCRRVSAECQAYFTARAKPHRPTFCLMCAARARQRQRACHRFRAFELTPLSQLGGLAKGSSRLPWST